MFNFLLSFVAFMRYKSFKFKTVLKAEVMSGDFTVLLVKKSQCCHTTCKAEETGLSENGMT